MYGTMADGSPRYQKWRWAAHDIQWSPTAGVMGPANETYIEQLIHELVALDPYAPHQIQK
jgi:hypothetical protein